MVLTLAFGFAAPWIAWTGAVAAAAPIVIHLLNRRRYRRMEWAAMRFVLASHRRNRRRLRFEEFLLLVLRCLLVLLIAWAVARPQSSRRLLGAARGTVDHCFVLDDSASMGARRGSRSPMAAARVDLAGHIEPMRPQDQLAIYRTSDRGQPWLSLGRPADTAALIERVSALTAGDTRGGLREALVAAGRALADSTHHKRITVLSDCRRIDW